MITRLRKLGVIGVLVGGMLLVGCSGEQDPLTKKEKASLKGGPMPQGAREGMAKAMADAGAHPFVHKDSDYVGGSAPAGKK